MAFIVPFIPAIVAGVTAVVGAVGANKQRQDAKKQGKEAQRASEASAVNAEEESKVAVDQSVRDEESLRRSSRMQLGVSSAALAEAGLSPDGSTGDLLAQSAVDAELDALNIRYGGQLAQRGLLSEAAEYRTQGKAAARSGRDASRTGLLLAGSQLLQGAAGAYGAYRAIPRRV